VFPVTLVIVKELQPKSTKFIIDGWMKRNINMIFLIIIAN
jgi:hypothetical protein